jgi:protein-disulfide isomerase/uncharacterized membrane protein
MKKNKFILLALINSALAIGTHIYLTQHHYMSKLGLAKDSICNINSYFNCDAISTSSYSEILGIPLALLGAFANLYLFVLLFQFYLSNEKDLTTSSKYKFIQLFSGFILAVSLIMGSISFLLIGKACLFCVFSYALSLSGFLFVQYSYDKSKNNLGTALQINTKSILSLALIPILSLFFNFIIKENLNFDRIKMIQAERLAFWKTAKEFHFNMSNGLILFPERKDVKMTIVEFADFLCPHCKHASTVLHDFVKANSQTQLVFKFYPLDPQCNDSLDKNSSNGHRCQLAGLVYCAESLVKKGWEVHRDIFANQEKIYSSFSLEDYVSKYSAEFSIDPKQLKDCVQSDTTIDAIKVQAKEGQLANIKGTPAIFVNKKFLEGGQQELILNEVFKSLD